MYIYLYIYIYTFVMQYCISRTQRHHYIIPYSSRYSLTPNWRVSEASHRNTDEHRIAYFDWQLRLPAFDWHSRLTSAAITTTTTTNTTLHPITTPSWIVNASYRKRYIATLSLIYYARAHTHSHTHITCIPICAYIHIYIYICIFLYTWFTYLS